MPNKKLLELLKEFSQTKKYLDDVNLEMIESIEYISLNNPTIYEHYNIDLCTYTTKSTEYDELKLEFKIWIKNSNTPIKITVLDSKELDFNSVTTYKHLGSHKQTKMLLDEPYMNKFVKYLSFNKLMYLLEMFGFILGYLTNTNLELLSE